jgi:hypothetical protein
MKPLSILPAGDVFAIGARVPPKRTANQRLPVTAAPAERGMVTASISGASITTASRTNATR